MYNIHSHLDCSCCFRSRQMSETSRALDKMPAAMSKDTLAAGARTSTSPMSRASLRGTAAAPRRPLRTEGVACCYGRVHTRSARGTMEGFQQRMTVAPRPPLEMWGLSKVSVVGGAARPCSNTAPPPRAVSLPGSPKQEGNFDANGPVHREVSTPIPSIEGGETSVGDMLCALGAFLRRRLHGATLYVARLLEEPSTTSGTKIVGSIHSHH